MANTSSLVFAGIAPHPPIMVPEVGREAIADVRSSIDAMAALTERVICSGAETVILISPHAPLEPDAFVAYAGPQLYADFSNFRAPTATVHAELDEELLNEITRDDDESAFEVVRIRGDLDHGTAVPLYFLQRNGWHGRVVALGYSFLSNDDHLRFGNCVRAAIDKVGRPVAFIASGDLSHRLKPGAPAGYNPQAHLFDEEVVDAVRSNSTSRIVNIDQDIRRKAGECGYRSMLVAIGVAQELESRCEVISYEAPFGVGYMVAQLLSEPPAVAGGLSSKADSESVPTASAGRSLSDPLAVASGLLSEPPAVAGGSKTQPDGNDVSGAELPALARKTIETFVEEDKLIPAPESLSELLNQRAACFVSIKTLEGDLRGCIGTIESEKNTLAEELIANAISAATRDPRFPPVRADELPNLKYSVDVLSQPELVHLEDLDPKVYGVIVEDEDGVHRGLLLPNLEGIDTAAKQVEIASRKAGIAPGAEVKLWRFRAERYSELRR
ncbi:MAG TPA: AmmeMemoRadiSam system protein A [Pyrinomonadaceae bacterium]|nr:AmmeMemoRadiSam system protein A [Pyrinomonadaceae bacterium]